MLSSGIRLWPCLSSLLLLWGLLPIQPAVCMTKEHRLKLRDEVKQLWDHGYDGYMTYAYPHDELKPITCKGQSRDIEHPGNYARNDVNGNYAVTHLDVLSTLPLMRGRKEFVKAIDRALQDTDFDQDVKVQVFEVTIRVLGSLLSSYQQLVEMEAEDLLTKMTAPPKRKDGALRNWMAIDRKALDVNTTHTSPPISAKERRKIKQNHSGNPSQRAQKLLQLALDLANRLMPAFDTPTGLPYARVNLKRGIESNEDQSTCSAAAGSLVLEFTLLSRLSGDPKFEIAARKAFMAVWERRSSLNLIGNTINVMTGHWFAPGQSGIGAGIDSLYEYALKTSIMVDDDSFMDIWDDAYAAVMQHHRSNDGHFYRNVHLTFGTPLNNLVDSLSAFWPGLQVLAGDVESAIKSHLFYWKLWEKHSAMPEAFNWVNKTAEWHGYPLRPEAIESTYYLHQATKDDFYLEVGERMLKDLNRRTKTPCGFAVIHDVFTGRREDRMESFMLSETLKYLYLLFDTDNSINKADSGTVFTTEGHRLSIPANLRPKQSSNLMQYKQTEFASANYQCAAYQAFSANGLQAGIRRRTDYDYVSTLVDMPLIKDEGYWSADATCMLPARTSHHFEILLSQDASVPGKSDAIRRENGHIYVDDMRGIKGRVTYSRDSDSYDLTSVNELRARPGQNVIITDPHVTSHLQAMPPGPSKQPLSMHDADPFAEIIARFTRTLDPGATADDLVETFAGTAVFGQSMWLSDAWDPRSDPSRPSMRLFHDRLRLVQPSVDILGCRESQYPPNQSNFIAFVKRGKCTFFEKLVTAKQHGALGVVVWGSNQDGNQLIRPSAEGEPVQEVEDVGMVYITGEMGKHLAERMNRGEDISVSFTSIDADFENLDIASVKRLIEQTQKDIDVIQESLNNARFESWLDSLSDAEVEDLSVEAMEDRLRELSIPSTRNDLPQERVADAFETAVGKSSTPVVPAGVMVLGLPIANLFIMPAT